MHLGTFVYFHQGFFFLLLLFSSSRRALLYFCVRKQLFYLKKVLAPHMHAPAGRCRLRYLGGACRPIRLPTHTFFPCHWMGPCVLYHMRWCAFFLLYFLLFLEEVHLCPLFFKFVNFNPFVFYCLLSSLVLL